MSSDGSLLWATYLGGSSDDRGYAIAGDGSGNALVTGFTISINFSGGENTYQGGARDAFVAKVSPSGSLEWATYLGGSADDVGRGIAVDSSGSVLVTGWTSSTNFSGANNVFNSIYDAFVAKVSSGGSFLWATYLGGSGHDQGTCIAVDSAGNTFVAGWTESTNFSGANNAYNGARDGFVAQVSATGALGWVTYLGGSGYDRVDSIAVDASGNALVTGESGSSNFYGIDNAYKSGTGDAFVAKVSPAGGLAWATYLGGSGWDWGYGIAVETSGNVLVTGGTNSPNFTGVNNAYKGGTYDAFVAKITGAGDSGPPGGGATNPISADESYTTDQNGELTVAAPGVLENDSSPDGRELTAELVEGPSNGSVTLNPDGSFVYRPDAGYTGFDSFTYRAFDGQLYSDPATVSIYVNNLSNVSGRVFDDLDGNGADDGEPGIAGVTMRLVGTDDRGAVDRTTATDDGGWFAFHDLRPGEYDLIRMADPIGYLDGNETYGALGGVVDNTQDWRTISGIAVGVDDPDAAGYLFAVVQPSVIYGLVWEDFNNDGEVNFGERGIEDVVLTLSGVDDRGSEVLVEARSDAGGIYEFVGLRPADVAGYTVVQTQPVGFEDGVDVLGTVHGEGGWATNPVKNTFVIGMSRPGMVGENFNFAERPAEGGAVAAGQTATIGFWQNKIGQSLIKSLNGSPNSTLLGDWLAATFPNLYGAEAGANNLAGRTNAQIADFYLDLFRGNGRKNAGSGPAKLDAQVFAVALATYVTNQTLASLVYDPANLGTPTMDSALADGVRSYGFLVTEHGVGASTFNVGECGTAFGVENDSQVTVLGLLFATNAMSTNGALYDSDGLGLSDWEVALRRMANEIYTLINEQGAR